MKILLVCEHTEGTDGWSRYSGDLGRALEERGHEVVPFHPPPALRFLARPYRAVFLARELWRLSKRHRPDILHITVEPYALAAIFLPKRIVKRIVFTFHGSYGIRPLQLWTTRWIWPSVLRRIPRFITVSNYTKNAIEEELKRIGRSNLARLFEERATVIHNGIPLPPWEPNGKRETGNGKHVLHVGGLKPLKGVLEAVRACAAYRRRYGTPFILSVIGRIPPNDDYVRTVREQVAALGLSGEVRFRGFVSPEELRTAYGEADLLLMPSLTRRHTFEGFGIVYLEANAYGVPSIGPQRSGAAEAIAEGVSGYRVDPENPEAIAERMHRVLDEGLISGDSCRAWAAKHDVRDVAKRVEEIYRTMR